MSADIVNLRQARKHQKRAAKEKQAEENRRLFGRSKAEKTVAQFEATRLRKALDGAEREPTSHKHEDQE
ncbi:DUF4169 family protein [Pseudovibrio sp. SPO723]|uniref:DUF4169 family protein n=1 Tax=Nesiotobacter zosterae TaxID=392721 RepID=UPI0029C3536C|nr:DUF4169 family protein [Pseudovibrio sp. SPO723]MDX5594058.1 DUF4169 family protein [Pseudovibrio sp. SPO723]